MNRRGFLKGTISVMAMAAVLKVAPKPEYTYTRYGTAQLYYDDEPVVMTTPEGLKWSAKMSRALARSMMTTREKVTADVLTRAFTS